MGDGNHITPIKGGNVPQDLRGAKNSGDSNRAAPHDSQPPKTAKENAAQLFDKKWHNAKADDLKNNLSNILSGGEKNLQKERGQANKHENGYENKSRTETPKNQTLKPQAESTKNQPLKPPVEAAKNLLNKSQPESAKNLFNKPPTEPAKELLNKTWNTLVNAAKEHKDLSAFRDQPKRFWNDVRQMSELRVVETFVHGRAEPRVVSRYGELLKQFERQGGTLQDFLTTLSPTERKVFQARRQIERTFGANELFVGKGIALDKRGDFPVRVFLSHNGKNVELPPHAILSLLNGGSADGLPGDFSAANGALPDSRALFTNGEFLLNTKNAALLGLSLALYQNIGVSLALTDISAEILRQNQLLGDFFPQTANAPVEQSTESTLNKTAFENSKNGENALRRAGEGNVAGALINGTFATIDRYRKENFQPDGVSDKSGPGASIFGFSAGATGAMMGATVGCIVPLAEKSVGEILGFAASVVVGLSDSGLRSLGASTLVSVITTGAQIFLSASNASPPTALDESSAQSLNAAASINLFEDDLRQTILNRRQTTLLAS